MRYQTQQYPIM